MKAQPTGKPRKDSVTGYMKDARLTSTDITKHAAKQTVQPWHSKVENDHVSLSGRNKVFRRTSRSTGVSSAGRWRRRRARARRGRRRRTRRRLTTSRLGTSSGAGLATGLPGRRGSLTRRTS